MRKNNQRGFTLAELLIVVAIIAVLTAIAIPVFTSQLEKSREATDFANVRSMYAEVMIAAISDDGDMKYNGESIKQADGSFSATISPIAQKIDGWTTDVTNISIGNVPSSEWVGEPKAGGSCTITYDPDDGTTVIWGGISPSGGGSGGGTGGDEPGGNTGTSGSFSITGNGLKKGGNKIVFTLPEGMSDLTITFTAEATQGNGHGNGSQLGNTTFTLSAANDTNTFEFNSNGGHPRLKIECDPPLTQEQLNSIMQINPQ